MKTEMLIVCIFLIICILIRLYLSVNTYIKNKHQSEWIKNSVGTCQTTGGQEYQSDVLDVIQNKAGRLAVLADGIGKKNTGKICAETAVQIMKDMYCQYYTISNPTYMLKQVFSSVHLEIQKLIDERRGGASLGAVFINGSTLYYALAGDIMIALYRNKELIPLSEGQTMSSLAKHAWKKGRLTKQEALLSATNNMVWNYVGMDGFHEIETIETPVQLKNGDSVLLMSKGVYKELPWISIEEVMQEKNYNNREKASLIVEKVVQQKIPDLDNGSVIIVSV